VGAVALMRTIFCWGMMGVGICIIIWTFGAMFAHAQLPAARPAASRSC
jgi:hypothetical protein